MFSFVTKIGNENMYGNGWRNIMKSIYTSVPDIFTLYIDFKVVCDLSNLVNDERNFEETSEKLL